MNEQTAERQPGAPDPRNTEVRNNNNPRVDEKTGDSAFPYLVANEAFGSSALLRI